MYATVHLVINNQMFGIWLIFFLPLPFVKSVLVKELLRERLSGKVYATIPKGIVGGFKFAVP